MSIRWRRMRIIRDPLDRLSHVAEVGLCLRDAPSFLGVVPDRGQITLRTFAALGWVTDLSIAGMRATTPCVTPRQARQDQPLSAANGESSDNAAFDSLLLTKPWGGTNRIREASRGCRRLRACRKFGAQRTG